MKAVIVLLAGTVSTHSAFAMTSYTFIVTASGTNSIVFNTTNSTPRNATLITTTSQWEGQIPPGYYTAGQWIWVSDPAGNDDVITVRHTFQIQCPGQ